MFNIYIWRKSIIIPMKPIVILLLDRGFDIARISALTGFSPQRIRYAKRQYDQDVPKLKEMLNKAV